MSDLVRRIKAKIPENCRAKTCKAAGCSIKMQGIRGARLIIDMDKLSGFQQNQQRCDYLFIGSHANVEWVVPLELKRGKVEANEVREQLQTGADFAARHLLPSDVDVCFRPVVAHGGKVHRSQRIKLQQQCEIRFQGKPYEIKLIRCESPLTKVLQE